MAKGQTRQGMAPKQGRFHGSSVILLGLKVLAQCQGPELLLSEFSPRGVLRYLRLAVKRGLVVAYQREARLVGAKRTRKNQLTCPTTIFALVKTVRRVNIIFARYCVVEHDGAPPTLTVVCRGLDGHFKAVIY